MEQPISLLVLIPNPLSRAEPLLCASLLLQSILTAMIHQRTRSLSPWLSQPHPILSPLSRSNLLTHPVWIFCLSQEDPSWHRADLGLQLRGWQRGGQGAAVLLRGHRLPGPPALSQPRSLPAAPPSPQACCSLSLSEGEVFFSRSSQFSLFSAGKSQMDTEQEWTRVVLGVICTPWVSPTFQRFQLSPKTTGSLQGMSFSCSLPYFPPNLRHKPHFASSKHLPSILRKCFPVGT